MPYALVDIPVATCVGSRSSGGDPRPTASWAVVGNLGSTPHGATLADGVMDFERTWMPCTICPVIDLVGWSTELTDPRQEALVSTLTIGWPG